LIRASRAMRRTVASSTCILRPVRLECQYVRCTHSRAGGMVQPRR
jgi:hypothetical protein